MQTRRRSKSFLAAVATLTFTLCAPVARADDEPAKAEPAKAEPAKGDTEPKSEPKSEPKPERKSEPKAKAEPSPKTDAAHSSGWEPSATPDTTPLAPFPPAEPEAPLLKVTPTGYIETYYAWNFNRPANNITNYRGFDNRHNTFTLSNAVLGALWETGPVSGKVLLQIGSTPSTYYNAEPSFGGASAANASGTELWKYLQEAYVSYKAPLGRGLLLTAGLIASPVGPEVFAVKDNLNWSRSNLFFALPYYHTGVRASYELTDRLSATVSVLNGWNTVVDNNDAKSVETHVTYRVPDKASVQLLYFGGIERPANAPEGQYWRHTFDVFGDVDVTSWLKLAAHANYGFEPNRFGTAQWVAGAAYARATATKWLYLVVRGDRFYEDPAGTPLFWNGVPWVSSGTATMDVRPHSNISLRVEFRHDQADGLLYFTGPTLVGNGRAQSPFVANARHQQTLLVGATAWF